MHRETLAMIQCPLRPQLTTLGIGKLGWPVRVGQQPSWSAERPLHPLVDQFQVKLLFSAAKFPKKRGS